MQKEHPMPTPESQRAHIKKLKALLNRFHKFYDEESRQSTEDGIKLSDDDVDLIERALGLHMAVIKLDMKQRGVTE